MAARRKPDVPRIALSRRDAAIALGVSVDAIDVAVEKGQITPKTPNFRADGSPTKRLYAWADLQRVFDQMEDA
jgi:hypothetical protein